MYSSSAEYTAVWNALDYVACVFPVTKVDPVLDAKRPPHQFLNAMDKMNYEFCMIIFLLSSNSELTPYQTIPKRSGTRPYHCSWSEDLRKRKLSLP